MHQEPPHWQPITILPTIAFLIDGTLEEAEKQHGYLQEARHQPWILDDAIMHRVFAVYTTQKDDLRDYDTQLHRWQGGTLTKHQRAEVARLVGQMKKLHKVTDALLILADELSKGTIEKQLAKDDAQVGLEYLMDMFGKDDKKADPQPSAYKAKPKRSAPETFFFFFFSAILALYDEPDGTQIAAQRFEITFPILPRQYASFTSTLGSVEEAQAIYGEMLQAMVMQTMQRDLPDYLDGFLNAHPEYPQAELRLHVAGTITVSGEACRLHEELRAQDMFRLIEEPEPTTRTQKTAQPGPTKKQMPPGIQSVKTKLPSGDWLYVLKHQAIGELGRLYVRDIQGKKSKIDFYMTPDDPCAPSGHRNTTSGIRFVLPFWKPLETPLRFPRSKHKNKKQTSGTISLTPPTTVRSPVSPVASQKKSTNCSRRSSRQNSYGKIETGKRYKASGNVRQP